MQFVKGMALTEYKLFIHLDMQFVKGMALTE